MNPQFNAVRDDLAYSLHNWPLWGRFGWHDVRKRYRRTTIGPFWATLSLGLWVLALGAIGSNIFHQELITYLPYLTSGMLAWVMFSAMVSESCGVFTGAESLIKQMKVSYSTLVCSLIWRNVILFMHNMIIYVCVAIWAGVIPVFSHLLLIPGLLLLTLNVMWMSILIGMLCARFRDVSQVVNSFLQIVMFVTPIFFSHEKLSGKMHTLTDFNFIFQLVNIIRMPLLGKVPELWSYQYSLVMLITGWTLTLCVFAVFRRRISYWL
jgi:ABC-type polysaccharide/polyol phosphate export permease